MGQHHLSLRYSAHLVDISAGRLHGLGKEVVAKDSVAFVDAYKNWIRVFFPPVPYFDIKHILAFFHRSGGFFFNLETYVEDLEWFEKEAAEGGKEGRVIPVQVELEEKDVGEFCPLVTVSINFLFRLGEIGGGSQVGCLGEKMIPFFRKKGAPEGPKKNKARVFVFCVSIFVGVIDSVFHTQKRMEKNLSPTFSQMPGEIRTLAGIRTFPVFLDEWRKKTSVQLFSRCLAKFERLRL